MVTRASANVPNHPAAHQRSRAQSSRPNSASDRGERGGTLPLMRGSRGLDLLHDLTGLQQTVGNQRVQHLVNRTPAPAARLVQRDVSSDIALDSPDYWTHLRSRTFTRLVSWIGDSRQKLNEFVAIMGDTDFASPWGSVALSWLQVLGTSGDLVNAVIVSLQALTADVDASSTLFEFRNSLERNFDLLSVRVNNLSSDLPIYAALRDAESKARGGSPDEQQIKRTLARADLERALNALPSPERLKQALVQRWIRTAGHTKDDASITYETSYRVLAANAHFTGEKDDVETRVPLLHRPGTDHYVAERPITSKPRLNNVQRLDQTIKALRNAYGADAPVHKLAFPMTIRFWISSPGKTGSLGGTPSFEWRYDPGSRAWAPVKGLGDEMQSDVFSDWYDRGHKPTLADLEKGFVR